MEKENKFLKYFGITLMIIGALLVLSNVTLLPQTFVGVGPISADIPQSNAVLLITGAIIFALGLWIYKERK